MSKFQQKMSDWAKKNEMAVDQEALNCLYEGQQHEVHDQLFTLLYENAKGEDVSEQGCSPEEYLPQVIGTYLSALSKSDWKLESLESEDDWDSASAKLKHDTTNDTYSFTISEIDNSDWVPGSLMKEMELFSSEKCNEVLKTFSSDDPFIILRLSRIAAAELAEILNEFTEPY